MLVRWNDHSMPLTHANHKSSWRCSSEGHWSSWQSLEQDYRYRRQRRQQDHRHRRIWRQQERRISNRYVRARRSRHEWPTRPDRAVASRLAYEQVESRGRGEASMNRKTSILSSVVNADGCHQVNSTRRQAATLLLCPRRSTKRLRVRPRPSAMLARVPLAPPARLETMSATLPRVL